MISTRFRTFVLLKSGQMMTMAEMNKTFSILFPHFSVNANSLYVLYIYGITIHLLYMCHEININWECYIVLKKGAWWMECVKCEHKWKLYFFATPLVASRHLFMCYDLCDFWLNRCTYLSWKKMAWKII